MTSPDGPPKVELPGEVWQREAGNREARFP
jgi:hypothetical protein